MSTLRRVNERDWQAASRELRRWESAAAVVMGRGAEAALLLDVSAGLGGPYTSDDVIRDNRSIRDYA